MALLNAALSALLFWSLGESLGWTQRKIWSDDCGRSKDYLNSGEALIAGGRQSKPGELPWQVSLKTRYGGHFCGGTIINQYWILTAAHCLENEVEDDVSVVVGEHDWRKGNPFKTEHSVSTFILHELHRIALPQDADIALVKLNSPIVFNAHVQPACMPKPSKDYTGMPAIVSGWGRQSHKGNYMPNILHQVTIPVQKKEDCAAMMGTTLTEGMICAGNIPEYHKGSCRGDSGGPLVVKNSSNRFELIGVVSWGYGCARAFPGIYANVAYYLDWMESTITQHV